MAFVLDVAFAEPYTGGDLLDGVGLGIASGEEEAERQEHQEGGKQQRAREFHIGKIVPN